MAKQRSPNYPAIDLETALKDATALYDKEKRSTVAPAVAVSAWGYRTLSGPARRRLSALRQYGLVEITKDSVKITQRALTLLLRNPETREWQSALRATALGPDIFKELSNSHMEASDDALKHHLVANKQFTDDGAKRLIDSFRATMRLAKLDARRYNEGTGEGTEQEEEDMDSGQQNGGYAAVTLAIAPGKWAHLKAPFPMTEAQWSQLTKALEVQKPGFMLPTDQEEAPSKED